MTKWKEEFDERYVVPFDDGTNDKFINVNPNLIKDFISNLIEQVVEDIDQEKWDESGKGDWKVDWKTTKDQLRKKYLNN